MTAQKKQTITQTTPQKTNKNKGCCIQGTADKEVIIGIEPQALFILQNNMRNGKGTPFLRQSFLKGGKPIGI